MKGMIFTDFLSMVEARFGLDVVDRMIEDSRVPRAGAYASTGTYALARALRAAGWRRPIVALTAHAMSDEAARCLAAGCDAYARKPIKRDALLSVCQHALARAARPAPQSRP